MYIERWTDLAMSTAYRNASMLEAPDLAPVALRRRACLLARRLLQRRLRRAQLRLQPARARRRAGALALEPRRRLRELLRVPLRRLEPLGELGRRGAPLTFSCSADRLGSWRLWGRPLRVLMSSCAGTERLRLLAPDFLRCCRAKTVAAAVVGDRGARRRQTKPVLLAQAAGAILQRVAARRGLSAEAQRRAIGRVTR